VQQNFNPGLAINGVLLTMYDSRLNLCRQVAEDAKEYFGAKVFGTPIPRNVRLAEAPSFGKPILLYDVQSVGAKSYLAVAQELLRRIESPSATIAEPVAAQPPAELNTASGQYADIEAAPRQDLGPETAMHPNPAETGAPANPMSAPAPAPTATAMPEPESQPEVTTHE
jgi:hypothetical protein